ncbi:hypothetical protein M3629_22230 [Paenibacillus polysaccharolyticus]|uniref:hypothetical protein n=1 Tax=Paenibacillus polysaccharolyticus TaxID=582692 RepID=UPI00203EB0F4|nr:hypothetical protein [Paenibacillus polysaccharolyticus]MCM3135502.1 hypothetical protein [Paenibacillus polysaccharolyticus]
MDLFRRGLREFGLPGTLFTPVRTKAHNPEYEKYIGMEGTERDERERNGNSDGVDVMFEFNCFTKMKWEGGS